MFFVVEADRVRLADPAQQLRAGRLEPIGAEVRPRAEALAPFTPARHTLGKTHPGHGTDDRPQDRCTGAICSAHRREQLRAVIPTARDD